MRQRNIFVMLFPVQEERKIIDNKIRFHFILCIKSNRSIFPISICNTILFTTYQRL